MKQALIIGLGKFGGTLAQELAGKNCDVAVIESDRQKVEVVKDVVSQSIVADATDREILNKFGKDVDFAVVSVGEKVDTSILIVYYLKEIGVKRIIAKATSVEHGEILKLIGADDVIFPQRDIAKRLANSLLSPSLIDIINLSDEFDIVELAVPNEFINHSIKELHLSDKYGIQVLVIKNPLTGEMIIMPPTDYKLKADDIIFALGKYESFKSFQKS